MERAKKGFILVIITIIFVAFAFFFDTKTVLTILLFLLLASAYITYKKKVGKEMIIAFLIALVLTSYYKYLYTTPNLLIGTINLFPLIAWTFGLILLKELYNMSKWKQKFIKITAIYIVILFLAEYVGYYFLKIQLDSNFPSLFGLGILHAPMGMKIFYITAGPIYLQLTNYLNITGINKTPKKNPA